MEQSMSVFISVICSAIIALIGWQVIFRNAKKLASRAESYSIISNINSRLNDIKEASDEFWLDTETKKTPLSYDTLVALKLREVQGLLKTLENRHISSQDGPKSVSQVRRACTLNSTKTNEITDSEERAKILRGIYAIISVCENEVYNSFSNKYPPLK